MGSTRTHYNTTTCLWASNDATTAQPEGKLKPDQDDTIASLGTKSIYLFLQIDNKIAVNHQIY
jgi:hypothetical protein